MDGAGSFGAGRSGSQVDPVQFAKQPQTVVRILAWIFSLVVFASVVNEGYVNDGSERLYCVFHRNADACNYAVFVGLLGLIGASCFLLLDYKFSSISSVKDRKKAVIVEVGFSGFWTFLYFVGFCFLANQWSRTPPEELPLNQGADAARATIAFSLFSAIVWAGLTVRAVQKYLLGTDMALFTSQQLEQPFPSSEAGGATTDTYQSPPFTENNTAPSYQVPVY